MCWFSNSTTCQDTQPEGAFNHFELVHLCFGSGAHKYPVCLICLVIVCLWKWLCLCASLIYFVICENLELNKDLQEVKMALLQEVVPIQKLITLTMVAACLPSPSPWQQGPLGRSVAELIHGVWAWAPSLFFLVSVSSTFSWSAWVSAPPGRRGRAAVLRDGWACGGIPSCGGARHSVSVGSGRSSSNAWRRRTAATWGGVAA